jgi:hypothetical protein
MKAEVQRSVRILVAALAAINIVKAQGVNHSPSGAGKKPNVVCFLVDNLGMGELSSYSGGPFRGVKSVSLSTTHTSIRGSARTWRKFSRIMKRALSTSRLSL